MSTIGIKYHNEDIHNIIRKPMSPTIKSPRYKSKSKHSTEIEKKKYNGHQTFGLAHYEAPESKNYLRKRKQTVVTQAAKLLNKKEFKCTINCKSSPLPKPSFEKVKQTKKNFVKENIKRTLALTPKVPIPRKVETPRGTSKDLAHLLQMIKIRESEHYGKIPKYLCDRKKALEKQRERQERQQQGVREYKEKMGIGRLGMDENVVMIDEETRKNILDGLKENWNELSKQFLKLPVMTDTWPKIKRKMCLEKEIVQLEKDIKLVESHPFIYLERMDRRTLEEIAAEESAQERMKKQKEKETAETEVKEPEEPEKEMDKTKSEIPAEEADEVAEEADKKEEDKEINIYNY